MRLRSLAAVLTALAGAATGLAAAAPRALAVAHAALLWAWAVIAWRESRQERGQGPVCLGCGRVAPGWLPDGSCMRCAQPRKPPLPRTGRGSFP